MPPPDWIYAPPAGPLRELHVDRDLVVVDKPSGLLSIPGRSPAEADSALTRVIAAHGPAYAGHRLDLDTSGVLLFARRRRAEAELHRQFREHLVQKRYVARVWGLVAGDHGEIDARLRTLPGAPRSEVHPDGKPSRTAWRVLSRSPEGTTLLELHPHTGRSHQLRVHLLHVGHPILGDRFYAPPSVLAASPRLCLHAAWLRLVHPYSGEPLELRAPVPFD